VDVDKPLEHDKVEFSSGIDVFFRIEDVQGAYLKSLELRDADLVLHPNVGQLHWSNFERLPELVRLGSDEVEKHLEEIRFLAGRRRWPWLRRGSSAPDGEWVEV
jgi:NTE family protein